MPRLACKAGCRPSGQYRIPITIQRVKSAAATDANGEIDLSLDSNWETYAKLRARVQTRTGREFTNQDQQEAHVTHRPVVPWSPTAEAIQPEMRLRMTTKSGVKVLNIAAVYNVDQMSDEVELQCVEVA